MARDGGDDDFSSITPSLPAVVELDDSASQKPFLVPNLEPLVRQKGLMLEQSDLLREQFVKFGESLQQLQGMLSRLQDDFKGERLERLQGQERSFSLMSSLRKDIDADRRKQEMLAKQLDDGLSNLREEVMLRGKVNDTEAQRISTSVEALKTEWSTKMIALVDKQQTLIDRLQADVSQTQVTERKAHETNLNALRDDVVKLLENELSAEANKRCVSLSRMEEEQQLQSTQFQEECLSECLSKIRVLETLRVSGEESLKAEMNTSIGVLNEEFARLTQSVGTEAKHGRVSADLLTQRVQEHYDDHVGSLRKLEECRLVDKKTSGDEMASLTTQLSAAEQAFAHRTSEQSEHVEEQMSQHTVRMSSAMASIESELQKERQYRGMTTVGLATEVSELKVELARELKAREEDNQALRATMTPATLGQTLLDRTSQLHDRTDELRSVLSARADELQSSMTAQLQQATDDAHLGREELWHVMGSVQDRATLVQDEVHVLKARTKHAEEDISEKVESLSSTHMQLTDKMESLHGFFLDRQTTTKSLLDHYKEEIEHNRIILDSLVAGRDFLESPNLAHRLYLTNHGDIAVFQSNNWGKHVGNFLGVPRWVAACSDQPQCAVNREMKPYEKDRFLALANRATPIIDVQAQLALPSA